MLKTVKIILLCCWSSFALAQSFGQLKQNENRALRMDGNDNEVRTGIGIINPQWTLEAWIKGDDENWKPLEAIIGGGEYSDLNIYDNLPLGIKNGYLYNKAANLQAPIKLNTHWQHVAISCDGKSITMYVEGKEVARADTAFAILPGAIGSHEKKETFGGSIDEVRIWSQGLSSKTIRQWMGKSITKNHPAFSRLVGYYNFDVFEDNMSVNWVGKGHQSYHLRNGRVNYYGNLPMAFTETSTNKKFQTFNGKQEIFNAVTIQNEWDLEQGTQNGQTLKLRIAVQGSARPLALEKLNLDLSACSNLKDIKKVHLYQAGYLPRTTIRKEIFGNGITAKPTITFQSKTSDKKIYLQPGINYFLVTLDLADEAQINSILKAKVINFVVSGKTYSAEESEDYVPQQVAANPKLNKDVFKVLQWNIWHGGVHLGVKEGRSRVVELIRQANADIVTLQEGYGAQDTIATSLGYNLQTKSAKDNLALLSRHPIEKIPSSESFKSNPAKILFPNGKKVLVNDCWLRYAYRPAYTCDYMQKGLDPKKWIAEDSILSLVDVQNLIKKDVVPHQENIETPTIIAGDFNSGSHLDWTKKAQPLHFGYGPVPLPTSRFMMEQGYKDSFREINPDELTHQGGTFAVIFGQLQTSRIDYIYYKGALKAIASKIVRTAPEIDDVWASDHAAVLSTFAFQ